MEYLASARTHTHTHTHTHIYISPKIMRRDAYFGSGAGNVWLYQAGFELERPQRESSSVTTTPREWKGFGQLVGQIGQTISEGAGHQTADTTERPVLYFVLSAVVVAAYRVTTKMYGLHTHADRRIERQTDRHDTHTHTHTHI